MAALNGVVVVPGFGGSQLSFRGGRGGKTALWYNPVLMGSLSPLSLAFDADGTSPYPVVGKTLFADGPVNLGIYEPLVTQLANDGFVPAFWAYDWRKGLSSLSAAFAAFLGTLKLTNPFSVVAHSMGGLVAQLAYPIWAATNPTHTWATTIYLGTPQGGNYWAALGLGGTYTNGSPLQVFQQVYGVAKFGSPIVAPAVTLIETALGTTVGSWPGIYCLLPSSSGPWNGVDTNAPGLLVSGNYASAPGTRQPAWFTAAVASQAALVAQYTLARPREVMLLGNGKSTVGRVMDSTKPGELSSYANTNDGDGTTTVIRGTLPVGAVVDVDDTAHNALCYTGGPLGQLKALLNAPPPTNAAIANDAEQPRLKPEIVPLPPVIPFPPPNFANKTGDP